MNGRDAAFWIRVLGLARHREGGYFRETWRSRERTAGGASLGSAIYFLLEGSDFSAFHRLRSDEIWHHYDGGSLTITMITPDGDLTASRLGRDPGRGESPQVLVPSGTWFAAALDNPAGFALIGCTNSPGFEYAGWELADPGDLLGAFPRHRAAIERFTRAGG